MDNTVYYLAAATGGYILLCGLLKPNKTYDLGAEVRAAQQHIGMAFLLFGSLGVIYGLLFNTN